MANFPVFAKAFANRRPIAQRQATICPLLKARLIEILQQPASGQSSTQPHLESGVICPTAPRGTAAAAARHEAE